MYSHIYFFPETRHITHQRRMNFRQCFLDHLRILVNRNLHPFMQTIASPCLLKDMGQRKETHRCILVINHRQADIMDTHRFQVIKMMKNDPLWFTGRARSIHNSSHIISTSLIHTDLYSSLGMCIVAQTQKVIKINRSLIFRIQLNGRIKNNQTF